MRLKRGIVSLSVSLSIVVMSGCSLADREARTIRVVLPGSGELSAGRLATLANMGPPAPSTIWGFTCFGLNVTGPGIGNDPRMQCSDPNDSVGIAGGFISVSDGGVIEMQVPAGSERRVQLFAVTSYVGCPYVEDLLNAHAAGSDAFNGIGDPFLVGETVVDLFDDADVSIVASYDPASSVKLFRNCDNNKGLDVPLTAVYGGKFVGLPSPSTVAPLSTIPVFNTPAPEITGVPLSYSPGTSVSHEVTGTYMSVGERAVIQLHWDVTSVDLTQYSYMDLHLEMAGGAVDSPPSTCTPPGGVMVQAGLFQGNYSNWILGGMTSSPNILNMSGFNQPLDFIPWTKSDGNKYIIVNVESNFVAGSVYGCNSKVTVNNPSLRLMSSASGGSSAGPMVSLVGAMNTFPANYCAQFTVSMNPIPTALAPVTLSESSGSGAFFSDSACGTSISSIIIPANGSFATVYYRTSAGTGNYSLDASTVGYGSGSFWINVVP